MTVLAFATKESLTDRKEEAKARIDALTSQQLDAVENTLAFVEQFVTDPADITTRVAPRTRSTSALFRASEATDEISRAAQAQSARASERLHDLLARHDRMMARAAPRPPNNVRLVFDTFAGPHKRRRR